jgi:hypothetical protein
MKISRVVAAICVLLLSSCAHLRGIPSLEERSRPQVTVRDGRIVVSPEILYYLPGERDVQITWQLPRDSKYRFPTKPANPREQGIVIEGRLTDRLLRSTDGVDSVVLEKQDEIVRCEVRNEGLEFVCLNRHTQAGVYKYTIRVLDPAQRTPLVRDPVLFNM